MERNLGNTNTSKFHIVFPSPLGVPSSQVSLYCGDSRPLGRIERGGCVCQGGLYFWCVLNTETKKAKHSAACGCVHIILHCHENVKSSAEYMQIYIATNVVIESVHQLMRMSRMSIIGLF